MSTHIAQTIVYMNIHINAPILILHMQAKRTALHVACMSGDSKSVDILLRNSVDTHWLDEVLSVHDMFIMS